MLQPLNGFTTSAADFADKPNASMSAAQVKAQFDAAPEELRVFVNSLIDQLNADFALKSELASALLGQIVDGSLTLAKLSFNAETVEGAQTKANTAETNAKNASILKTGLSIKTGTISNGGTIPQTGGYTNYHYFVSINNFNVNNLNTAASDVITLSCSVNQSTRVVTATGTPVNTACTVNYIEIAW